MRKAIKTILGASLVAMSFIAPAQAAGDAKHPAVIDWSFNGAFGTYDRDALRRGYQVYKEVCAL